MLRIGRVQQQTLYRVFGAVARSPGLLAGSNFFSPLDHEFDPRFLVTPPRLPQERVQRYGALQQELLPAGELPIRHDPRTRRGVLPVPQDHRARTHPQEPVGEDQGVNGGSSVELKSFASRGSKGGAVLARCSTADGRGASAMAFSVVQCICLCRVMTFVYCCVVGVSRPARGRLFPSLGSPSLVWLVHGHLRRLEDKRLTFFLPLLLSLPHPRSCCSCCRPHQYITYRRPASCRGTTPRPWSGCRKSSSSSRSTCSTEASSASPRSTSTSSG